MTIDYVVLTDSLHYARTCSTNKFLHSEANQLIQHIIVQDQDGQNNNITEVLFTIILYFIIFSKHKERLIVSE